MQQPGCVPSPDASVSCAWLLEGARSRAHRFHPHSGSYTHAWLGKYATLGWNVVGAAVVAAAAITAGSVALAGFGLDSLIEILLLWW